MGWRQDSGAGAFLWDTEPMTRDDLALRDEEIQWLMSQGRPWSLRNGRLQEGRGRWVGRDGGAAYDVPVTNGEGTYGALAAYPLPASESALTLSATEQGLLPSAHIPIYMPLPINGILTSQAYRWVLTGIFTSVATSGTLTLTHRIGNANTSPSLGASAAQTLTASLTNGQFVMKGEVTVRSVGLPGLNSTAIGTFTAHCNSAVGGAATVWLWGTGTTAVSFDSTIAAATNGGGIWTGMTFSANFPNFTLQQVHMMDWN